MGFLKSLLGFQDEKKEDSTTEEKANLTFVTEDEENDFEESIYGKIQEYSSDIIYIKEVLRERGESLEKQINLLTQLLDSKNDENDPDVQNAFNYLQTMYKESKRMADGEYTIKELEKQNRNMDRIFERSLGNGGIDKIKLDEFISYISKIQQKVNDSDITEDPILQGVQRQKFNSISIYSEYRIRMLELMYLSINYGEFENPFKGLSKLKQKIFSGFFVQDLEKAQDQYRLLSYSEELFNNYDRNSFDFVSDLASYLSDSLADATMVEDFSVSQMFDSENSNLKSFEFLKKFITFKTKLNQMQQEKIRLVEKYKAEQEKAEKERIEQEKLKEQEEIKKKKEKERKEKLLNMSDEDISNTIHTIEQDLTASGSKFINILDFQKSVARAKGLLDTEQEVQNDQLSYYIVDTSELIRIIEKANKKGINYMVFPDSQERDRNGKYLFIVSQTDADITNNETNDNILNFTDLTYFSSWNAYKNLGKYNTIIARMLQKKLNEKDSSMQNKVSFGDKDGLKEVILGYRDYSYDEKELKKQSKFILNKLEEIYISLDDFGVSEKFLKEILCYVKVPTTRNIIAILEEFERADIKAYMEPEPSSSDGRNSINRDFVHIYFKREDLDKVEVAVLPEISNSTVGIATIQCGHRFSLGRKIKDNTVWPENFEIDK